MNRVVLMGRLGDDPEVKTMIQSGTAMARIRLATRERRRDGDGNWSEYPEWHTVIVWGNRADVVSKYVRKGDQLLVEGRIQTREWESKDGQKRWSTEVVASDVELIGGGNKSGGQRPQRQASEPAPQDDYQDAFSDDDVPF